jgi:hypothetical protein
VRRALLTALVLATGCGAGDDAGTSVTNSGIAFEADFQAFRSWRSFVIEAGPTDEATTVVHLTGRRTEYLNRTPPAGATTFPPGTIIVKEIDGDATTERRIFAMAKRPDAYNTKGAVGWEWFELAPRANGAIAIRWRGVGPPNGEAYAGDPTGGCNSCHGAATGNDFVHGPGLQLGAIAGTGP